MRILNRLFSKTFWTVLLFVLLSPNSFAAVSNCRSGTAGQDSINLSLAFNITSSTSSIAPGSILAIAASNFFTMKCNFTGDNQTQNTVYFRNEMPVNIKNLLLENGVEVTQRMSIGGIEPVTITDSTVPDMDLGHWSQQGSQTDITFALRYEFIAIKGANALKPFDTGVFYLGRHVDYQGQNIGAPIYISIKGDLTLLCPSPEINITASNAGSVDFGAISPQQMNSGGAIARAFNLGLSVTPDCETGLNISVRFVPNGNTIIGDKYLDMGNGLQVLINNGTTDVNYNEYYAVGEILPFNPVNLSYIATLSKISGSTILSGPFSKTIKVIVSY